MNPSHPSADDAVLARRARVSMLVTAGKRVGYGLFLVAIVGFAIGFAGTFSDGLVSVIVGSMVVGSLILGAVTLQEFGIALLVGLVVGGYSSVVVASDVVARLKEREPG